MPLDPERPPVPTPNLEARLTAPERAFRKTMLDLLVQHGKPVSLATLSAAAGLPPTACAALTEALRAKQLLVCNAGGEITGVYPVSALPTPHRVTLADGRALYAMCAIDALGCAFEFGQDTGITSVCSHCRQPLRIAIAGGKLSRAEPDTIQVLHVDLDSYANWAANC